MNSSNQAWLPDKKPIIFRREQWSVYFKNFCERTYLHGWKYIVQKPRTKYERLFWLSWLLFVHGLMSWFVIDALVSYKNAEPYMTFDNYASLISEIPFPAVTICPDNQIKPSLFPFAMLLKDNAQNNLTIVERFVFDYATFICDYANLNEENSTEYINPFIIRTIMQAVQSVEDCTALFTSVRWHTEDSHVPCNDYLQPMVSPKGACFSFNMVPVGQVFKHPDGMFAETWGKDTGEGDWTPDDGFWKNRDEESGVPRRTDSAGIVSTLRMQLDLLEDDFDGACSRGGNGLFVYIHNPIEMPSENHQVVYLEPNKKTLLFIKPHVVTTSDALRDWHPNSRRCYFNKEKKLSFFAMYTQRNCELECEANLTLHFCGCIPFYHPRLKNSLICGPGKSKCVVKALSEAGTAASEACDCKPSCSEIQYSALVTSVSRNLSMLSYRKQVKPSSPNSTFTFLRMKFKERFFIPLVRQTNVSMIDLIANIGGFLGLYIGFSLIVLAEILKFSVFDPLHMRR